MQPFYLPLHIVLIAPQIPSNTGNIMRLCANVGCHLHLVEPLGFDLCDKKLRRAGLDYQEFVRVQTHKDWQGCKNAIQSQHATHFFALTTKQSRPFYEQDFVDVLPDKQSDQDLHIGLVFGSESHGLDPSIREDIGSDRWLRLPMQPHSRSLNLANSVAICVYEVWRQHGFKGDVGRSTGYDTPNLPRNN